MRAIASTASLYHQQGISRPQYAKVLVRSLEKNYSTLPDNIVDIANACTDFGYALPIQESADAKQAAVKFAGNMAYEACQKGRRQ
jgi:hypothetical protein